MTGALAEPLPVDPEDVDHHVYLGRGWTLGLAHEAALKTREAAQAWAESHPAMDYRHGSLTAAGPRTAVWFLGSPPLGLIDEVAATGAHPVTSSLDPLVQLVQVQRMAVRWPACAGSTLDQPRHL